MELFYYLRVFAKADWVQFRNGFRTNRRLGCGLVALLLGLPFGVLALVGMARTMTEVAARAPIGALLPQVPGGLVSLILLGALVNGTTGALQSIFLASDLEPLLATPAPVRAIFLARLLHGLAIQIGLTALVGMTLLTGYGLALSYPPAYFVALPLLLGVTVCLPTGLGAILALLFIRLAPVGFTRDFVNVANILLGLATLALTQLLPRVRGEAVPLLSALNSPLLPSTWAGQALVAIGERRWADALPASLALVSLSLAVFGGSLLLTEQQAANGIAEMAVTRGARRRRTARAAAAGTRSTPSQPRPIALVILRKELRTYLRDTANLQPVLFSVVLGASWLWGTFHGSAGVFSDVWGNVLAALAIATLVARHPGLSALSREGPNLWQLQSAPVAGADVALGKLAFTYLPYLAVGVPFLLIAGVLTRLDLPSLGAGAFAVALLGWGCAAVLINLAFRFPRLEWKTTSQQENLAAWLLAFPCLGLYALPGMFLILAYRLVPPGPIQFVTLLATVGLASGITWLLHRATLQAATPRLAALEPPAE
jgi:hypothetical protein